MKESSKSLRIFEDGFTHNSHVTSQKFGGTEVALSTPEIQTPQKHLLLSNQ